MADTNISATDGLRRIAVQVVTGKVRAAVDLRYAPMRPWSGVADTLGASACSVPACGDCWWPLPNTEPRVCIHCGKEADRG